MSSHLPPDHPPVPKQKIGVVLLNLGTPDATDYWSVRRYLKEFLSDPRVIETPKWLWWPILNLFILPLRPRKTAHKYASIWTRDGSPLLSERYDREIARQAAHHKDKFVILRYEDLVLEGYDPHPHIPAKVAV